MAAAVLLVGVLFEVGALTVSSLLLLAWGIGVAYLLLLVVAAALRRRPAPIEPTVAERRLDVLIPAHNEELLIGRAVAAVREQDYPGDRFRVVVIADNCSDRTAEAARAAGAIVHERTDTEHVGKGYALAWVLERLLRDAEPPDAVVVMDADTFLSRGFLRRMNAELDAGHHVVQAYYTVLNPSESWRTRLMTCALALVHYVKPLGRQALGLPDALKGNGMCFAREVLERVPWSGESITEDIDYTLRLLDGGYRVRFCPHAVAKAQMPVTGAQAASQRMRWEGGRYALARQGIRLLGSGLRRLDLARIDRGIDLLLPPLAELAMVPSALVALHLAALAGGWSAPAAVLLLWGWAVVLGGIALYIALGLAVARTPWRLASALVFAPAYVLWKLGLYVAMALRGGPRTWVRTERHEA